MSVKKTVNEALSQKMSRKDFLGQVGALLLAVVGVSAVLKSLGNSHGSQRSGSTSSAGGQNSGAYGSSSYGG
ncbi:MAG TPA: hypothetical protein VGS28_02180 [Candidatus Saccharimonadales bacterium]|nr:hypothetical protein [Candidatus Saccharimonadales bacterium]